MTRDAGGGAGSDNWQPAGTESVKVDINGLQDFAKLLQDELKNQFDVNLKQGVDPMLRVRAPMGVGGLKEAQFFQQMHSRDLRAVGELLKDVTLGLTSLSAASLAIFAEYLGGDNLSSASVDDVNNAFFPPVGMMTLSQKQAQDDAAGAGGANAPASDPLNDPNVPEYVKQLIRQSQAADPVSGSSPLNPDGAVTVDAGQPGAYTIPEDSDHMHNAPNDPYFNQ